MENEKVDKKKYLNILTIVISIIIITLVGTYALKLWTSTDNTELTFRIGDYTQVSLNCKSGEDVTINNIGPVYDYLTDGEVIPFSVIATKSNTSPLNIKFNINTISDNLKEVSFKYVLLSSIDKNNYNEELRGSFVNSENNTCITLVDNLVLTTSRYYKLIIYIDGNMENPISMQNGSLTGNIEMCMEEEFDVSLEVINGTVDNSLLKVEKDSDAIFNITPSSGYKLEIDSQTCNGVIDSNTGNYTITNITENKECSLALKEEPPASLQTLTLLGLTSNGTKSSFVSVATTNEGVFEAEDDLGTSYYFRGAVTNNYVKFANFYWRIIRINGDGSIRMIYDGTSVHDNGESSSDRLIGTKVYNSSSNDNAYVGYMYGITGASTYEATHANTNNSTIKNLSR